MKPRILPIDIPVDELAEELYHTTAHLQAYPSLQAQTAQHEALIADWNQLFQTETALTRALTRAEARVVVVDVHLDFLCTAIDGTVRIESGGDRKSPIHQRYFGNIQPSRLKRPVLGVQLETMRDWIPSLTDPQSSPTLQAYGNQLGEHVTEADAAVQAEVQARRNLADHTIRARKAFIDKLNAVRQALYGQLAELPHSRPELGLPPDFAHHFFLRETRRRKPTITTLERDIARLQGQLQRAEAELARLIEEAAAETKHHEDAELADAEAELAALEQQRVEAAARIAELQARRTTPSA
jgi:hypothetical protein